MSLRPAKLHRSFSGLLLRIRVRKVKRYLNGRILDIGCCSGPLVPYIPDMEGYVGIDIDSNAIRVHRERYPDNTLYCLDVQDSDIPQDGEFDTMVAMAVLEHLERPEDFLDRYVPLVRHGGTFVFTTPTPLGDHVHKLLAKFKIANPDVGDVHFNIFKPGQLAELIEKYGIHVESINRFEFGMNQILTGKRL